MRTKIIATLLSISSFTIVSPALADEVEPKCSKTAVFGWQGSYPFQDFGTDASNGKDVSQNVLAVTCGNVTVDWWSSTQLTGGDYGNRGTGDEHDIELTYADSANTPAGPIRYEAYAGYFAVDLGDGLGNPKDDVIQLYGEVARPIPVKGGWKATPFVRYLHLIVMGDGNADLDFIRAGARLSGPVDVPIVGMVNVSGEAAHAFNLNKAGTVPHKNVWRGEATVAKPIGKGWTLVGGAKFTEHAGVTPLVKVVHTF